MKITYDDSVFDQMFDDIDTLQDKEYRELANLALNFYIDSFNNQGFTDSSFEPWEKSLKDNGATLVLTGNLRNSLRITEVSRRGFTIESNVVYAEIHNEGGIIPVSDKMRRFFIAMGNKGGKDAGKWFALSKKSYITIPKRTFMDESETLNNELVKFIFKFF